MYRKRILLSLEWKIKHSELSRDFLKQILYNAWRMELSGWRHHILYCSNIWNESWGSFWQIFLLAGYVSLTHSYDISHGHCRLCVSGLCVNSEESTGNHLTCSAMYRKRILLSLEWKIKHSELSRNFLKQILYNAWKMESVSTWFLE